MLHKYGSRGVIALHAPMQNINMQPEFEMMRPDGVNNQIYRIELGSTDDDIAQTMASAVSCEPDVVALGVSMEMHDWSAARQIQHRATLQAAIGDIALVLAADATVTALRAVGAQCISILSPMGESQSASARAFYEAMGFAVAGDHCLGVQRSADIPKLRDETILEAFETIDRPEVDTLLHVGGALCTLPLVERLEARHGKAVVSVNAATYWMSLRWLGIEDRIDGFGKLLTLALPEGARLQA